MGDPLLVTIAFSHFCDKARWALDRAGIRYRESGHLPIFHVLSVRRAGGRHGTPTLVTDEGVLEDSTDILAWIDRRRPEVGLYGKSAEERRAIEALEERFDTALGPHSRRWAYFHLLPDRALSLRLFDAMKETPEMERRAMRALFPLGRMMMRMLLRIDAPGAERSGRRVDEVFAEVGERLADGRRYLVGDRLTAADITFAALASPALLPEEARLMPRVETLPAAAAARVRAWREHPAGAFGLRMYREHRHAVLS